MERVRDRESGKHERTKRDTYEHRLIDRYLNLDKQANVYIYIYIYIYEQTETNEQLQKTKRNKKDRE